MTSPLDYQPDRREPPKYSPVGAWIAWIVIILCVGFIVVSMTFPQLRGKSPAAGNADAMNFDLTLRLTIGQFQAFKDLGAMQPELKSTLTNQIRPLANTPVQQLQTAAVIGEIEGKDAALRQIDGNPSTTRPATLPSTQSSQAIALRKIYTDGPAALTPQERAEVEKLNFAGEIALIFSEQERATTPPILKEARNRFWGMVGWLGTMGLLALTGLVLAIIAIVMVSTGSLKLVGLPLHIPGVPFVEAFALYLVLFFAGQVGLGFLGAKSLLPSISLIVLLIPIFYYVHWRGESWANVFEGFGFNTGKGVVREIGAGIIGYIAGLPLLILGFMIALFLMKMTGSKPSHPVTGMVSGTPWWMLYLLASVWAPIFEETMFRGALLHHLRRVMPWIGAAPIVSVIFAMIHPQGLAFIPALGAIAMMLAALREWRGSIIAPMVAHGLSNAATITLLLIMLG